MKKQEVKDFYTISLGEDTFRIPADYLPDERNRKDGAQESVIIMGTIPDFEPLENGASYKRFPHITGNTFRFILSDTHGKKAHPNSLLYSWAKQGHYTLPETWEQEELVHLGIHMLVGKRKQNVYAYIKDGQPIAQLLCGTHEGGWENPSCRVYQDYRDYVRISPISFNIENLDWYAEEGLDKILRKVESWRIKPDEKQ